MSTEGDWMARKTARVVLFGGMLDGREMDIVLDEDGQPPLERNFIGFATCTLPYRLAAARPDGAYVYVPLYG